jgi:pantoate--beta-alanine ligase
MIICTSINSLQGILSQAIVPIHFVPTMGALHDGHLELIRCAKKTKSIVVCSIFINPTQFNEIADLEKYPRTTAADIKLLITESCDILFLPDVAEIYPQKLAPIPEFDTHGIEDRWEGVFRPGHFKGMLQVVHRLLDIVKPSVLYMGQKDFQQQLLVKCMLENIFPNITLITVPTVREYSGLAMSSRNSRLSYEAKKLAPIIFTKLYSLANHLNEKSDFENLIKDAKDELEKTGISVEYLAIVNPDNMEEITKSTDVKGGVIIIAAWLENIRLIDNIIIPVQIDNKYD